ncbi:DUF2382 domain-containing protein [Clostridium sp. BJN0013]|uniref:DUF2382 domain-containing protein n=1 Tax=Clostridium sp. BJN0013 TaxID=3236840 RepID=UPI0034C6CD60
MGLFDNILGNDNNNKKSEDEGRLTLHKEELDINKNKVKIDIHKQPVALEDVSVSNNQYKEIKHITKTLKKEVPHISTKGDVKIVDKEIDKKYQN